MQWIFANLFLLIVVCVAAGLLYMVAYVMRALSMEPDAHHTILFALCFAVVVGSYFIVRQIHRWIAKRIE